jgi:hypothetical protein
MKISELCKMIENSIHSGKYPLDQDTEKQMAGLVQVINRSLSDDLKDEDIRIEVKLKDLYVLNNYIQGIQHLPGVIEIDALDSFKMLSRRMEEWRNLTFQNKWTLFWSILSILGNLKSTNIFINLLRDYFVIDK